MSNRMPTLIREWVMHFKHVDIKRLFWIGLSSLTCLAPAFAATVPDAQVFQSTLRPFLEKHCFDCHDDLTQKGNLRLDNLPPNFADPNVQRIWTDVFDEVATGQMPPKKEARPPEDQKQQLLSWLKRGISEAALARRNADGRVVLRRLNRNEYENTVHDLLGIDVNLKDLLPEDASSMGFDNISDALSVSSVLMERYLEAADAALASAIQSGTQPPVQHWDVPYGVVTTNPNDYRLKTGVTSLPDGTFVLFNSGDSPIICDRFSAPAEGEYKIRVRAYAYRSPGTPLTMSLIAGSFDPRSSQRRTIGYFDVPPEADHARTIEFTERLPKKGSIKIQTYRLGKHGLDKPDLVTAYMGPGVAIARVEVEGPLNASWPPPSHKQLFQDLDFKTATFTDAEKVLRAFAPRAFRRPVESADIQPYLDLVKSRLDAGEPFEDAIRLGLKAILCSPEFLFLHERSGHLDDYAVASRLSYFLWSSLPDDELIRLASDHTLTRPDVLRRQTERLLADPKSQAFTNNFTGQWLGLRQIDATTPDKRLYSRFDDLLQWSSVQETRRFFDEVLKNDLSVSHFIDSDFAMLNGPLAELYSIEGITGTEFRKAPLPAGSHRGGLLTQSSILKVTANGTSTSPVTRGAWVMRNILGQPPKPQPPNIPAIEPDTRGATTIREQLARHRNQPSCAGCHAHMDPPGFALESFDVIGGWRENYHTFGGGLAPKNTGGPEAAQRRFLAQSRRFGRHAGWSDL